MPKPVLTEVLADLLPFQQAVSNELGKLMVQIYTGGAAVRVCHQRSLSRTVSLCREQQKRCSPAEKGHFQEFPISHHTEGAASKIFLLALKRER